MANINANIAKKVISYVRHGVDINSEIKQIYNNSLIFIGDESQIYVPAMNTYVGIGTTAYTATINRIASVEEQIRQLAETLSTDLVSKIYANYTSKELVTATGGSVYESEKLTDKKWALNNDVTIKGINDYDPATGFARKPEAGHYYTVTNAENSSYEILVNDYYHNGVNSSDTALPTSGIRVTPHWGEIQRIENSVTHQVVEKRVGNYITIDDSLTWSYMTSAYSYTMNFAKKYTASEIDRLYHNLLGDSEAVYEPIALSTAVANVTAIVSALGDDERTKANYEAANPGKLLAVNTTGDTASYWTVDSTKQYAYATYVSNIKTSDKEYHSITAAAIVDILEGGSTSGLGNYIQYTSDYGDVDVEHFPQLYVQDTQYDSTYNMNIQDGINTLKEVAYLLDLLSDGQLGQVTYLTYDQLQSATWDSTTNTYSVKLDGPDGPTTTFGTYTVINPSDLHPKGSDNYAYFIKTGNPENLGIQIAYSIAGNKVQIDDLHSHTDLIEKGKTTLRSVKTTNSDFVTFSMLGGTTHWADTDSNQGESSFNTPGSTHPNESISGKKPTNSYLVGDVNLQVKLNTALTYATSYSVDSANPVNTKFTDDFGVEWYGCYTLADMNNLDPTAATYYTKGTDVESNGKTTATFTAVDAENVVTDTKLQDTSLFYYWVPNAAGGADNNALQNRTFGKISKSDLSALSLNDELKAGTNITKSNCAAFYTRTVNQETGAVTYAAISGDSTYAYVNALSTNNTSLYYLISVDDVAVHPYVGDNALATTEWVGTFVDAKVGEIADNLDDILEQAKQYTDEKIDALDNNYKFSDFATYWNTYVTNLSNDVVWNSGTANEFTLAAADIKSTGSYAYTFTYNDEYAKYVAANRNTIYESGADNPYRLSYITKSQYIHNIVEENGIVNGESRELPTDEFAAKAEIWGSESNADSAKHEYEALVLPSEGSRTTALFQRIYNWQNANADNQIFVRDTTVETYIAIDPTSNYTGTPNRPDGNVVGGTSGTLYALVDGVFVQFETLDAKYTAFTNYASTTDKRWIQLYQKGPAYVELDFSDTSNNIASLDNIQSVVIGDYTLTKNGSTGINVTKGETNLGSLLCIKNPTDKSTKYFSVETKHFSYVENGAGENAVSVTAHITRIEDAAQDNTGFADAYDVQTWVENYFTWVDVSATVTTSIVESSDKYHKQISLAEYNGTDQLYKRVVSNAGEANESVQYSTVAAASVKKAFFWKDDDTIYSGSETTLAAAETAAESASVHGSHVTVNGNYLYEQFNENTPEIAANDVYDAAKDNYYIRIEEAKINPLNLTETLYK